MQAPPLALGSPVPVQPMPMHPVPMQTVPVRQVPVQMMAVHTVAVPEPVVAPQPTATVQHACRSVPAVAAKSAPVQKTHIYVAPADYTPQSVKEAWDNYHDAFNKQDLSRVMLDYDETSHVRMYNNTDGAKSEFSGTMRISQFFQQLFAEMTDVSSLDASVVDIDEDAGQVFLVWKCPGSGILAATETLIFSSSYKIWKHNIVHTKVPRCAAALVQSSASLPATTAPAPQVAPAPVATAPVTVAPPAVAPVAHAPAATASFAPPFPAVGLVPGPPALQPVLMMGR